MKKNQQLLFYLFLSLFFPCAKTQSADSLSSIVLTPAVSLLTPNTLVLTNNHFTVPYLENMSGFPVLRFQVSKQVLSAGPLLVSLAGGVGYGFYQGNLSLQSTEGNSISDYLYLHWIPISGSVIVSYKIPGVSFMRPGFELGGGVDWLIQAGSLNGVSDSFWLPALSFTPSITFLETDHREGDWFGGFSFSVSFQTSFATRQAFNGWGIQIGQNILF